jgi:dipeptidyl-peptidase III
MGKLCSSLGLALILVPLAGCSTARKAETPMPDKTREFKYFAEQFADLRILRYQVPGFDSLEVRQKELIYYLYQAGLSGRDILWDQHYKHNLCIRRTLENIVLTSRGDRNTEDFGKFMVYVKRVWFSNGIHHHYSTLKILPGITPEYFAALADSSGEGGFPLLEGETVKGLVTRLTPLIFDPKVDAKRVSLDPHADLIRSSANNFYEGLTQAEVEAYYKKMADPADSTPVSYGLNSKLIGEKGRIREEVWKVGGMYGEAIGKMVFWLEKAVPLADSPVQRKCLEELIRYYRTGDLRTFDEYSISWVKDTESMVDLINGFIETYGDPLSYRGSFESLVYFKDLEATRRIAAIAAQAQWFEDHSPILPRHRKKEVRGISARVITAVVGAGDNSPSSPIGINLPNANWIRKHYGSKSVSIGNLMLAYAEVNKTSGLLEEFLCSPGEVALARQYLDLADNLLTDLHEVIGHASGQIDSGVGEPRETLKNYASTLEEARADLVALYYLLDPKLVEIGVMPSLDAGRVAYDDYISNALLVQLARIAPGQDIEEAHMRDRQLVARWVYEKGVQQNVIEKTAQDGRTCFAIRDYDKLRVLFGELLREVQRIESEGDFAAGQTLVETFGVKVDPALHEEVLARYRKLNIAPYSGFLNPVLTPVEEGGRIVDVKLGYAEDFTSQMLYYASEYSFLPTRN